MNIDYASYPNQDNVDGVQRWIEHGIRPGHFLTAIIENDLVEAVGRADSTNMPLIPDIVRWFYNEAPSECWGSQRKAIAWATKFFPPYGITPGFALDDGSNDELAIRDEFDAYELNP